jgi:hypothetical protein
MTDAWAKRLADEKLKNREKKQAEQDKILSDRNLIKSKAPEMWETFKKEIANRLAELKDAMHGEEVITLRQDTASDRLSLHDPRSGQEIVGLPFHRERGEMPTLWGEYVLQPYGTNDVVWLDKRSHSRLVSEDLSRQIVQRAFEAVS